MDESQQTEDDGGTTPSFLAHLEQVFGWSEEQAVDALGAYMLSTEAGRALCDQLAPGNLKRRAA
jgi:hypothetical protein